MNRIWRLVLLMAALCVGLGAMSGAAVAKPDHKPAKSKKQAAKGGELDTTFGKGGKVTMAFPAENAGSAGPKYTLPFEFTPGHLEMAQAPDGKVVVAGATKIVRYLANGKLDQTFGAGGTVTVPGANGSVFVLAGVAVDSQGRILLAGLARPLPTNSTPDPLLSSAAVMRFTATGALDQSFGNGGVVVSDLGFGAPKAAGGPYLGSSVGLRDIAVDAQNRPVLTGAAVTEIGSERGSAESQGFIARLTEAGALDQTFGEGGVRTLSTLTSLGQLAPAAAGYLALTEASSRPYNSMVSFNEDGNLESNFGSFGFRALSFDEAPALSVAPSGKILLLGRPFRRTIYKKRKVTIETKDGKKKKVTKKVGIRVRAQTVQRLLPSGAADPGFGRVGRIDYLDPQSGSLSALAVDGQERIYMVGRIGKRVSKSPNNPLHRTQFLIERAEAKGPFDKSFGKEGVVTTGFGGPSDSFATQLMFDRQGRILVGGGITSPQLETGGGFAIARYLPGK